MMSIEPTGKILGATVRGVDPREATKIFDPAFGALEIGEAA